MDIKNMRTLLSDLLDDFDIEDLEGYGVSLDNYWNLDNPAFADEGFGWDCELCSDAYAAIDSNLTEADARESAIEHLGNEHLLEIVEKGMRLAFQKKTPAITQSYLESSE